MDFNNGGTCLDYIQVNGNEVRDDGKVKSCRRLLVVAFIILACREIGAALSGGDIRKWGTSNRGGQDTDKARKWYIAGYLPSLIDSILKFDGDKPRSRGRHE